MMKRKRKFNLRKQGEGEGVKAYQMAIHTILRPRIICFKNIGRKRVWEVLQGRDLIQILRVYHDHCTVQDQDVDLDPLPVLAIDLDLVLVLAIKRGLVLAIELDLARGLVLVVARRALVQEASPPPEGIEQIPVK